MKRFSTWFLAASLLALAPATHAQTSTGEDVLTGKCKVTATAPTPADTSGDADCVWDSNTLLKVQCTGAIYFARDGSTPDADYPLIAVGDPYPFKTMGPSTVTAGRPKFLPVTGTVTCNYFRAAPL